MALAKLGWLAISCLMAGTGMATATISVDAIALSQATPRAGPASPKISPGPNSFKVIGFLV